MKRPTLAVDLGGTIEDSWSSKRAWFLARGLDIGPRQRSRLEIIDMIGGDRALYERMADEIYSDASIVNRTPVLGAAAGLASLAQHFRVLILSTREARQRLTTLKWLNAHDMNHSIEDVVLLGATAHKLAWCEATGVSALVDDDLRHLHPTPGRVPLVLVHFCPGSHRAAILSPDVTFANTWMAVVACLLSAFQVNPGDS